MALNRLCSILPADEDAKPSPDRPSKQSQGIAAARRLAALARRSLRWLFPRGRLRCSLRRDTSRFEDTPGVDPTLSATKVGAATPGIFSYAELYIGTNGFSDAELLGSGGFGRVYRAVLPGDGTIAAVKCVISGGGGHVEKTFAAELTAVARLRHRNLVRLRGWCVHDGARLLLIYDYMPNRSLDRFLFAGPPLAWEQRRHIVSGLAAALFYLHEELDTQIIHRDVKASNVMLDAGFNTRLGDFGLARWLEHEDEMPPCSSDVSNHPFRLTDTTRFGGTIGYLPPEGFQRRGAATAKSDVFGFGIVALEVATGRRAADLASLDDEIFLLDWVRRLADEGRCLDAGDHQLPDGSFPLLEMKLLIHIGLLCSVHDPHARPTMKWVVSNLAGEYVSELPALPSFRPQPQYLSLSFGTTTTTTRSTTITTTAATTDTTASLEFVTAGRTTVFLSTEKGGGTGGEETGQPIPSLPSVDTPREIPFDEIFAITDGFSESRVVAHLDFGISYEGVLEKRYRVLVKRLGMHASQALRVRFSDEFRNLARLRHRHLVQLRGWCTERGEMLVLYDYTPAVPLSGHLFCRRRPAPLAWHHRYAVVKALASAVLYLHEEQVVHRNITSAAILLDPDMSPRLGCFALAESLSRNEHAAGQRVAPGVFGYMAPEYMVSGEVTTTSDVYSFGVVVLEVVTGQPAVDWRSREVLLVRKASGFEARRMAAGEMADRGLEGRFDEGEVARLVGLGIACTRSDPAARPTIRQVNCILHGNDPLLQTFESKKEGREEWEGKNATSLSLIRRIQALDIH